MNSLRRYAAISALACLCALVWMLPDAQAQTCEPRINVPDYETGSPAPIICDTHGSQHVKLVDESGSTMFIFPVGTANVAAPTHAEGAKVGFSFDLAGNARFTLGTYISGEDPDATGASTNGVMVTEHRYLSSGQKTADAQIKASAGYVSHMICQGSDAAAVAGTIILHDALTETGTEVFKFTVAALDYHTPVIFPILTAFATGIYLGYTTTTDVACTVFSR